MSTCLFSWPDRVIPSAIYTPTFTGGSWSSALPLTNLLLPDLGSVARSSNALAASTTFDIDLKAIRQLRLFAIPDHNLSFAATIQVQIDTEPTFSTPFYDSGAMEVWPRYYPVGSISPTHESYADGKLTLEAAVGLRPGWWYAFPPPTMQGRYIRVTIVDTANSAGYVQLNRFICAPVWQPAVNMSLGAQTSLVTTTEQSQALGGAVWFDRRTSRRSTRLTLESMTPEAAMVWAGEMQRILGIDGELFFVFDPDDTDLLKKQRSYLATLQQLNPIEYPYATATRTAFDLIEKL